MRITSVILIAILVAAMTPSRVFPEQGDLVVADFERLPNNLGGDIGVYGSLEPNWKDSKTPFTWFYTPLTYGYSEENVHSGKQSFRLVNGLGGNREASWGSVGIELGPVIDQNSVPRKTKSVDVSTYKYLAFWIKGEKGGERLEVIFRDANATTYEPQVKYKVADASTKWQRVTVPLNKIRENVDLKTLVHIGFAFGDDVGNEKGAIIYLDDIVFTNIASPL